VEIVVTNGTVVLEVIEVKPLPESSKIEPGEKLTERLS
jgi:hypothetical protein